MQVKKFEAKSMKEALELVKAHLGPEAIILSAKDSHRGFGLIGERSVEVTAAVSDETLRRKKLAETKLREEAREQFQRVPAAQQKKFIARAHADSRPVVQALAGGGVSVEPAIERPVNHAQRYIDIEDEAPAAKVNFSRSAASGTPALAGRAGQPAKSAAQSALSAQAARAAQIAQVANAQREAHAAQAAHHGREAGHHREAQATHVAALENQVRELKSLVERFQTMPQMSMNLHPGAEQGLSFELSQMYQRLTSQGVQPVLVANLLRQAQAELELVHAKNPALVEAWVVRHLLRTVKISADPCAARYQIFLGSTGQGKTSTLVKLASHLMLKERRTIAIVSLDTVKIGAADQLRLYAQILNVPFAVVRNPTEWAVAEEKLKNVRHILVDCPGFSLHTAEETAWLNRMLPPPGFERAAHFVQSILSRDEDTVADRYQSSVGFDDVIFTRLDDSARGGSLLNFQDRFKVPLHSFATGTRIPEDYEFADRERVVHQILNSRHHRGEA